jgi:hypothetical protein
LKTLRGSGENVPAQAWVTLIVGLAATVGVLVTWRQKNTADRRSEWWRRTAWAFERSLSDNNVEAQLGWKVLDALLGSTLVTNSDSNIVQVIAEHVAVSEYNVDEGQQHGGAVDPEAST